MTPLLPPLFAEVLHREIQRAHGVRVHLYDGMAAAAITENQVAALLAVLRRDDVRGRVIAAMLDADDMTPDGQWDAALDALIGPAAGKREE